MDYFVDNDIVHKLARFNLLASLPRILGCDIKEIFVLPTTRYKFGFKTPEKAKQKWGEKTFDRIQEFCANCSTISDVPPAEADAALANMPGIDAGEHTIYGVAAYRDNTTVVSGDKTCMRAITNAQSCSVIAQKIKGRVLCLEQILSRFVAADGCDAIQDAVIPEVSVDMMTRSVFGSSRKDTKQVTDGLQNYIADLRKLPVDLLRPD